MTWQGEIVASQRHFGASRNPLVDVRMQNDSARRAVIMPFVGIQLPLILP